MYSHHWVLRPPSVRGVEVAKASAAAKARVCILYIATRWSLKPESDELNVFLFLFPLGLATTTVVIYYTKVKFRGRYIQGRYLCTDGGPSRPCWSLNPARPLYPRLQNPAGTVYHCGDTLHCGRWSPDVLTLL